MGSSVLKEHSWVQKTGDIFTMEIQICRMVGKGFSGVKNIAGTEKYIALGISTDLNLARMQ